MAGCPAEASTTSSTRVLQIKATVEDENSISTMPLTWKFAYRLRAMANPQNPEVYIQ